MLTQSLKKMNLGRKTWSMDSGGIPNGDELVGANEVVELIGVNWL